MLLESIRACHYSPSAWGCDLCAGGHPAEVVSCPEGAELQQQEQDTGLAIYAGFVRVQFISALQVPRWDSACSHRSCPSGCVCSPGSPGTPVLSCGVTVQVICERNVGPQLSKATSETSPTQVSCLTQHTLRVLINRGVMFFAMSVLILFCWMFVSHAAAPFAAWYFPHSLQSTQGKW